MSAAVETAGVEPGPPPVASANGLEVVRPAAESVTAPMREFLVWVAFRPRTYMDVMDAWQSHCPRFTLWEDALEAGLVELGPGTAAGGALSVCLTARGQCALDGP